MGKNAGFASGRMRNRVFLYDLQAVLECVAKRYFATHSLLEKKMQAFTLCSPSPGGVHYLGLFRPHKAIEIGVTGFSHSYYSFIFIQKVYGVSGFFGREPSGFFQIGRGK